MPSESAVVTRLRQFKTDLLFQESAQMQTMARRWLAVEQGLESQIAALTEEMSRLRATGEEVSAARVYRMERYQRLLAQAQAEFARYADWAEGVIVSGQTQMVTLGVEHAIEALGLVAVEMSWDVMSPAAVENMIGMTADGPLADLLAKRMDDARLGAIERLTRSLVNGTAQGWNPRKTARLMRDDLSGGLSKALQIARTEQVRVYREAGLAQYRTSGIVEGVARLCAHQPRTCLACLADEGHVYPLDTGVPDHVQGRCSQTPVLRGVAPPAMKTGEEWFREQDEGTQLSMMGRTRYEAWKSGDVRFADLATPTANETWGPGVRVTPVRDLLG